MHRVNEIATQSTAVDEFTLTTTAELLRGASNNANPYEDSPLDITFFVSCYNEADFIIDNLNTLSEAAREFGCSFEVIVVDDCSSDNSREVVRQYIADHPDENIMLRANGSNKGWAQNYVDGAFIGKGKYYRPLCGDSGEPKESMLKILRAIGTADCVVPYYVPVPSRALGRLLLSTMFTGAVNWITGNKIRYYNGLGVHLRYNVMRWHSNTKGFGFQADLLCILIDLGFSYVEVPVVAYERKFERSKALNLRNYLSVTHTVIEIANRRLSNFVYARDNLKKPAVVHETN